MVNKEIIIKCPHCGYEYLPAEIFYPNDLLGEPFGIIRDKKGKIIHYNGSSMNLVEEFTCEHCNHHFVVELNINHNTYDESKDDDFEKDFEIKLNNKKPEKYIDLWGD